MREILFRGKQKNTGDWFYGNLFGKDICGRTHITTTNHGCLNIDPETVGQFTGMTDKNGKRIFEGDRGIHKIFGEVYVKYLIQECAFVYVSKDSDHRMGHRNTGSGYTCDVNFEVLGTIYDNKELLK